MSEDDIVYRLNRLRQYGSIYADQLGKEKFDPRMRITKEVDKRLVKCMLANPSMLSDEIQKLLINNWDDYKE